MYLTRDVARGVGLVRHSLGGLPHGRGGARILDDVNKNVNKLSSKCKQKFISQKLTRADALLLAAMATARLAIFFKALKRVH